MDDFRRGHAVCVDCGLVVPDDGGVLGNDGCAAGDTEQQRARDTVLPGCFQNSRRPPPPWPPPPPPHQQQEQQQQQLQVLPPHVVRFGLEEIWQVLSRFHLEANQETRERAQELFEATLLRRRETGKADTRCETGRVGRTAVAFAVARTLNELEMPRPLEAIARMSDVPRVRDVLQFGRRYHVGRQSGGGGGGGGGGDELDESEPSKHVAGLCAVLSVPFRLVPTARQVVASCQLEHRLYGSRPHHIAAAAVLAVAQQANRQGVWANAMTIRDVCNTLDCRPACIRRAVSKIDPFVLSLHTRPPSARFRRETNPTSPPQQQRSTQEK